jgi:NAD(P)-dependent dehydrogenase (short-subunit alcohol dehydrogenase family)
MNDAILITGGTGKIGSRLVEHFHSLGRTVVFTSRSDENIAKTIAGRERLHGIKVDFTRESAAEEVVAALDRLGLDVSALVNNARDLAALGVEDDGTVPGANWLAEYRIDVVLPYQLTLALAKKGTLRKVVNVASMYGMNAFNPHLYDGPFRPPLQYACAKAALIHLTKCLAVQFAPQKIAVNCVTYGGVEGRVDDNFKKRYAALCPMERMMKDDETVGSVDFLLSEKAAYITGQNIVVDGGWSIW